LPQLKRQGSKTEQGVSLRVGQLPPTQCSHDVFKRDDLISRRPIIPSRQQIPGGIQLRIQNGKDAPWQT
jgi:hypothetical protein